MGRKIKITESKLKQIISESVKRILKEGSSFKEDYVNWEKVKECLGCEGMLSELYNYLSCDQISNFINAVDREYELNLSTKNEEVPEEYGEEDELYESLNEIGDTPKGQFALGAVKGKYDFKSMNGGDFNTNSQKSMDIEDKAYNQSNNVHDIKKQRDMWDGFQQGVTYGHNKQYK
jgi:hypothetical protein